MTSIAGTIGTLTLRVASQGSRGAGLRMLLLEDKGAIPMKRGWTAALTLAITLWLIAQVDAEVGQHALPQPVTSASASAPTSRLLTIKPRLTDDRKTLLLLEEVRKPPEKRQPEITLSTNRVTGRRQISITAHGMRALPKITVICGPTVWPLSLSSSAESAGRSVATYEVPETLTVTILSSPSCHVAVAGALLPIPRDLLSVVWGSPADSSERRTR